LVQSTGILKYLDLSSPQAQAQAQAWLLATGLLLVVFLLGFLVTVFILWLIFRKAQPVWKFIGSVTTSVRKAVADNPDVKELVQKHLGLSSFLKARFKRGTFSGWPATLLFLAFVYALLLLVGSIEDFVTSDVIVAVDTRIANILYIFRSPGLTGFFLWVTLLGKWQVVIAAAAAVTGLLFLRGSVPHIPGMWVSLMGGALFSSLGKIAFHRPRPEVALYLETTWSFPSGHATVAVAFYGFLLFLIWRLGKRLGVRILGSAGLIMVIASIGFSRLYLGVHYLSDVWSGYLLGLLWVIIGVSAAEALHFSRYGEGKDILEGLKPYRRIASIAIIAAALVFYVLSGLSYAPPRTPQVPIQPIAWEGDIIKGFTEKGFSPYSETILGTRQEPISFIIKARGPLHLKEAFSAAGWSLAQQPGISNLVLAGRAALLNVIDTTAPMTPSLWEGNPHGFGFQKPVTGHGIRQRHHARFWVIPLVGTDKRPYYVGTASLDVGLKWFVTHRIAPDIDTEREFLFNDLLSAGEVKSWEKRSLIGPSMGNNFAGDPFFTDGQVYILELF